MKNKKSIKKNYIYNTILTMSSVIFPLITFPYISRTLMPDGMGKVSFATSLISYFVMLSQLGMPTYGIRTCSKVRGNRKKLTKTAQELLGINLIMCVVSYMLLSLALLMMPELLQDRLLYLIVSSTIFLNSIGMEWLYKALEQYRYIAIRSIFFKLVALIAMFALVHDKGDYVVYGFIAIFASSASNICNFINVHKYIDLTPVGNYNMKRHLKPLAIFFAMACATTIYTHMDTLMLGFMCTKADVGYYNAAVRIKVLLVSIVTSLGVVLLPRSSTLIQQKKMDKFREVSKKALDFVFIMSTALMLYFMLYTKFGIMLLSGGYFEPSIRPMKIVMPTLLFIGITNITGIQIMVPMGREKSVLLSEVVGLVINLVLNSLLIPQMESEGAAIGTLAAEFGVLVVQYFALRSEISQAFRAVSYWKIVLGLAAGTVCSYWVAFLGLSNFMTLAITTVLFFGVYLAVLLLTKEWLTCDLVGQLTERLTIIAGKAWARIKPFFVRKKTEKLPPKYDYLVVGSGLFGSVFAHEAAARGKSVLVVDKRANVGGNVFTENTDGINVHVYGAHIFHTNDRRVWNYITQFAEFNRFTNSPVANYKGELYSLPFNMYTFNRMWGVTTPEEADAKINEQRAEISGTPRNLEEQAVSLVGRDIFEKLVRGYTEKQWGRDCSELPAFIIKRLPVRLTFDNNYFDALWQGIPAGGYTALIENLLDGVEVRLNTDYLEHKQELDAQAKRVIYTGPIDAYFGYSLGYLEYRSVRFENETLDMPNFQGNAVVNYTDSETPWTRIIEHKWFEFGKDAQGRELPRTVISREYSSEWKPGDEPYYPLNDSKNNELYEKYRQLAEKEQNVVFGGRLAQYRYFDMDQVVAEALSLCDSEFE